MHAPLERRSPLAGLSSALLAASIVFVTSAVAADAPTLETLVAMGEDVRGTDATRRTAAIAAFGALGDDAFPALEARVLAMRRERRTAEDGYRAIDDFGRAVGAAGPNQDVDVVRGLALVLDRDGTVVHRRVAERVLVLRALERIGTARAVIAMLPLLTSDMSTYRWYARHLVRRMGRVTVAALVLAAQHRAPDVDLFAGWAFGELGITDAGHAVQDQSAESLAEILRAYAGVKHLGAMPVVASFVGDDRAVVRAAAHEGMLSYAENGIWQLRALHQSRLGRPASEGASFRDLLARLEAHAEDRRTAPFRARIALAEQAFTAGRLEEAVRLAKDVEARAQGAAAIARLAPIHAAAADAALARGELDRADASLARALHLDPHHAAAPTWRTQRAELETARLARLGIEPWPDAPRLDPARDAPSGRGRWPFALAALGLVLLLAPTLWGVLSRLGRRVRARAWMERLTAALVLARTTLGRRVTVVLVFAERARSRARSNRSASPEAKREAVLSPGLRRSTPTPEAAADEARTRLSLAAEAARARLGAKGASVPPPSIAIAAAVVVVEPERASDLATAPGLPAEPTIEGGEPFETTLSNAVVREPAPPAVAAPEDEVVALCSPEEPVHAPAPVPASTRHERPKRRASLSPELVFGVSSKPRKRSAR